MTAYLDNYPCERVVDYDSSCGTEGVQLLYRYYAGIIQMLCRFYAGTMHYAGNIKVLFRYYTDVMQALCRLYADNI